jgi:hypothetical protein
VGINLKGLLRGFKVAEFASAYHAARSVRVVDRAMQEPRGGNDYFAEDYAGPKRSRIVPCACR